MIKQADLMKNSIMRDLFIAAIITIIIAKSITATITMVFTITVVITNYYCYSNWIGELSFIPIMTIVISSQKRKTSSLSNEKNFQG